MTGDILIVAVPKELSNDEYLEKNVLHHYKRAGYRLVRRVPNGYFLDLILKKGAMQK